MTKSQDRQDNKRVNYLSISKDLVVPILALVLSGFAGWTSWNTAKQNTALQKRANENSEANTNLNFYIDAYEVVNSAVDEADPGTLEVAVSIARLVKDDEVKDALLALIDAATSTDAEAEQEIRQIALRADAERRVLAANRQVLATETLGTQTTLDLSGWRLQVLFCESNASKSLVLATDVSEFLALETGAEVRLTPVSILSQDKFSSAPFNINYTSSDSDEREKALTLEELLEGYVGTLEGYVSNETDFRLRGVRTDFGDHMSVYVCPQ